MNDLIKITKSTTFYAYDEYPSINLTMETRKKLHMKILTLHEKPSEPRLQKGK